MFCGEYFCVTGYGFPAARSGFCHDERNSAEYAGGFSRPDRGAAEWHPEPDQSGVRQGLRDKISPTLSTLLS